MTNARDAAPPVAASVRARVAPLAKRIAAVALAATAAAMVATPASAAPRTFPPAPARWVTDEAHVLSPGVASAIDAKLEAFEKRQGSQVLVAIYPKLPPDEALEEYTHDVAEAWKVGRAKQDDGIVLFAFVDDRALRLEVGYGLEGALTDLESKRILEGTLIPYLRQGDWDGGFQAATDAILTAIEGEYEPTPGAGPGSTGVGPGFVFFVILIVFLFLVISARRQRHGRWKSWNGGGGGPWSGGGWGGGSFGGGGGGFSGGGFSGGGGSFGGGGASARW